MSAPQPEWMKTGPTVPAVCIASFVLFLTIAIVAPLAAAGVIPFGATL